jgi:hypothetical protein
VRNRLTVETNRNFRSSQRASEDVHKNVLFLGVSGSLRVTHWQLRSMRINDSRNNSFVWDAVPSRDRAAFELMFESRLLLIFPWAAHFASAGVAVAGPSPTISSTASMSFAPS